MSFDIDDPLAGILSDESDDSFFNDDILGKKKTPKKVTPAEKKTVLNDQNLDDPTNEKGNFKLNDKKKSLFNLDDEDIKPNKTKETNDTGSVRILSSMNENITPTASLTILPSKDIQLNTTPSIKNISNTPTATLKSPAIAPRTLHNSDKIDLFDDLNKGVKKDVKRLERGKSSQSILDDILGTPTKKLSLTESTTLQQNTTNKNQELSLNDILGKTENKSIASALNKPLPKKDNPIEQKKEELIPKKNKSSDDWLGIFQDNDTNQEDDMPSWLLGSDNKKNKSNELKKKEETKEVVKEKFKRKDEDRTVADQQSFVNIDTNPEHLVKVSTIPNIAQYSNNEDLTAESTALYLQQQEAQLMVALQLKAQEEKLAAIQLRQEEGQRVQREASRAQHQQVDAMLERHTANRIQMQSVIAAHQERINERIKALLGPPNLELETSINQESGDNIGSKIESPHLREKKQLLQLVQSLQENHDKEIDLMETSYRRQLAFIEVSLNQSEDRMKEESDKLVKFYTEKIVWLEDHHLTYKRLTEDSLQNLMDRHGKEIETLRQQHFENIKVIQEHHAALMENIKNAVKQEQSLIQESSGFSTNLNEILIDAKENKTNCESMLQIVKTLAENTQRDAERNVQMKNSQINDMLQQLKKDKEIFEIEKTETRDMVKLLESRLKQMTQFVEDESSTLKQKRMEFEFEKATFNKQTEFAKNILKQQDEEIKKLREDIQKEYQLKIANIEEDKGKLQKDIINVAKEKSSIQILKQELETMKAELHVQLEQASEERSKLNLDKQNIQIEGQRIVAKSRDLELLAKAAVDKQSASDQKYAEAENIQRKYEERIRRIQEHVVSLNSREKQIAREKVALSRERLSLHNERKLVESRQQCSLCKSMHNPSDYDSKYAVPEPYLAVSRDYAGVEVNSAMNNLEHEMAHLLGRNLGLKAAIGGNGPIAVDEERHDVNYTTKNDALLFDSNAKFKEYMDPKLQMLRLDVQRVLSNIDQSAKADATDEDSRS